MNQHKIDKERYIETREKKEMKIRELLNKKDLTDFELDLIMNDLI